MDKEIHGYNVFKYEMEHEDKKFKHYIDFKQQM